MDKNSYAKRLWKPITTVTLASSLFFLAESTVAAQAAEMNQASSDEVVESVLDSQDQQEQAEDVQTFASADPASENQGSQADSKELSLAQSFPKDQEGLKNYQKELHDEVAEIGPTEPSGNMDWVHIYETGNHNGAKVSDRIPEVRKAFGEVAGQSLPDGALSQKTKEHIAIAISADDMCTKCITSHTINNLKQGTTRQEMAEVMGVVELYGGGPKTVSGGWVIDAYDTLKYAYEDEIKAARIEDMKNEPALANRKEQENKVPQANGQTNWANILKGAQARINKLDVNLKDTKHAFSDYIEATTEVEGALTVPQKQLIALTLAVNKANDEAIAFHTKNLLDLGVYRREVAEALSVHFFMGGATDVTGSARALDAYDYLYHYFYPSGQGFKELKSIEKPTSQKLYSDEDLNYDNQARAGLITGDLARNFPTDKEGLKAYKEAIKNEVSRMADTEPSGNQDWVHIYETANHNGKKISALIPEVKQAFGQVAGSSLKDGAVSQKTKELVAMVLSGDDMCTKCITSHTLNSLKQGVTRQEMAEAMAIVELFGGGPKGVSGAWVIDAYDTLKLAYEDEIKAGRLQDLESDQAFDRSTLENKVPKAVGDIDWLGILATAKNDIAKLDQNIPDVAKEMKAYVEVVTGSNTALSHVQKELLALSLAVNKGSDSSIVLHIEKLLDAGVYRQEVAEALSVHFFMGGAADALYAARALDAYDALYHANYAEKGLKDLQAIESYESKKLYNDDYQANQPTSQVNLDHLSKSLGFDTESLAQSFPVDHERLQVYKEMLNALVGNMDLTEPSGHEDWVHIAESGNHNGAKFGALVPAAKEAFGKLAGASLNNGAVNAKVKEYIAIALSADDSCTKCITAHTINNLKQGTTRQEMAEVMGVVELFGGGPNTVRSGYVMDAYDTLAMAYEDDIQAVLADNLAKHSHFDRSQHENIVPQASGGMNWLAILNEAKANYQKAGQDIAGLTDAFNGFVKAATQTEGALSPTEKEFVALSLAVNNGNDAAIALHIANLLDQGVHRQEVAEVLSVAFFMGGAVDGLNAARALDAYDSLYHALYAEQETTNDSKPDQKTEKTPKTMIDFDKMKDLHKQFNQKQAQEKVKADQLKAVSQSTQTKDDHQTQSQVAQSSANQTEQEHSLPQTGIASSSLVLAAGSLLSGLGLSLMNRRKK